jgi:DNA-binding GntR family transcriptional regulator
LVTRLSAFAPDGSHRTLAEKAFGMLHDAVVSGSLSPGERLPIEDLAAAMGMSPMPIREALRRLDSVGLVENVPHRGARVRELSVEDLEEVYDARLALELPAIRGAAERFNEPTDERVAAILERHAAAVRGGDDEGTLRTHTEFHMALYEAAESRWLMRLISPLWESAERYRVATLGQQRGYMKSRMDEHERILAACRDRRPDVAEAELWNHLALTANAVSEQMGGSRLYEPREVPGSRRRRRKRVA